MPLYELDDLIVDDQLNEITRELRRAVEDSIYSQREIADRLPFSQSYLSKVIAGRILLTVRTLLQIASVVGIDPAVLLDPDDDDERNFDA